MRKAVSIKLTAHQRFKIMAQVERHPKDSPIRALLEDIIGWGMNSVTIRLDKIGRDELGYLRGWIQVRVNQLHGKRHRRTTRSLRKRIAEIDDYLDRSGVELLGDLVRKRQ